MAAYEKMVELTYLSPAETPEDAEFVSVQVVMRRLEQLFPTFVTSKGTDAELGKRLAKMGYERKRLNNGVRFRIVERQAS